ncbi:MAG TPA: HAD-IIIA family hydrolase [Candidatus Margulisiibacteriota bacterium]|nr:HAD-IIIA family hydrolase [Candidatus Margulisiibacteriota bacterium]
MLAKPKLIIFDLDGTLINAYPAIISSLNFTLAKFKLPLQSDHTIRRAVGWGDDLLLKPFIGKNNLTKALYLYRRHHQKALLEESFLFPRAKMVLRLLRQRGFKIAVASNRPSRFSRILIRHLGLKKYFDYVLCADVLKHRKPHPLILQRIMRHFSVEPKDTLYVGDMNIDAQAGRRAGVKTVIVTTGSSDPAEIKKEKPGFVIKDISALLKLLF